MHAAFEAPVGGSEHEGRDSIIVCSHYGLFEALVSLPYTRTVVLVESSQGFNLVAQVLSQWLRKAFDEAHDLLPVIVLGKASPRVLLKQVETRRKRSVLLYIAFHDSLDICYQLYAREENLLFGIVVVVHGFTPALTICQVVSDRVQVFARYVRRLEVDGVQPPENAIVGKCHLRCDIVCRVGGIF